MSRKISKAFVIFILIIVLVLITIFGFVTGFDFVRAQNQRLTAIKLRFEEYGGSPITPDTPNAVEVKIPRASDVDDIAEILKEEGLIGNTMMYKLLSKFNGFNDKYAAGTHYLLPDMSYDEIMFALSHRPPPITITFPEGMTYTQIKQKLKDEGLTFDEAYMDSLVRRPNAFIDYPFVRDINVHENREWVLQGYLWPDTYQFDSTMTEEQILRVFLNNTKNKLAETEGYAERAAQKGLTMDQVITLASIIQAEGTIKDMNKIGKVFLNRIEQGVMLESCATINYLRLENGEKPVFWVQQADLDRFRENPYNTYANDGLPPGPINNPGTVAIEAVLWPATERTWPGADSYLYFASDGKGNNVFASTLEEHQENVNYYRSLENKPNDNN